MDLTINDIVELLQVPEKTIHQWIKDKQIPCHKIQNRYFFNKSEIQEWIATHHIPVTNKILELQLTNQPVALRELLKKGGIFYNLAGATIRDIMTQVADLIPMPATITKADLLETLLRREEMWSTAVGKGIAFPHPRNPMLMEVVHESVSLCFLATKVDYRALDGEPVHILFVILSSQPRRHLEILSRLAYLCQQAEFITMLHEHAGQAAILAYVVAKEQEWERKQAH